MAIFIHNLIRDLSGGSRLAFLLSCWEMRGTKAQNQCLWFSTVKLYHFWILLRYVQRALHLSNNICWFSPLIKTTGDLCRISNEYEGIWGGALNAHKQQVALVRILLKDLVLATTPASQFSVPIHLVDSQLEYGFPRKFNRIIVISFHRNSPWLILGWWCFHHGFCFNDY